MSLREQVNFLITNKFVLLASVLLSGLFGVLFYFVLPTSYSAVGYLYVSRATSVSASNAGPPQDFTYEGYYARQNAVSYVPTVLGLIESDSTSRAVLESLQQPVTTTSLRKFERAVSVKKPAPQIIELSYKSTSSEYAVQAWKALVKYTMERHYDLNSDIDPNISIKYLTDDPVVKESYRSPMLNFLVGALLGWCGAIFILAFKYHLSSPQ